VTYNIYERLRAEGIQLPPLLTPVANYAAFRQEGALVQVAAVAPVRPDGTMVVGKVGRELSLNDGYEAARLCAIHLIAVLSEVCSGDFDRVRRLMMVRGFVNAAETFESIPQVIDGASDLLLGVFGPDVGRHARTSIGCVTLPSRVAVEVDVLAVIEPDERG
jgi:enamine deaminase RidA (YjgF/YER057c/UK114 family)